MSTRRLPAEIYWRRRFLVLALVLALAWGVITLWPAGGEPDREAAVPVASPSASPSADPVPSEPPEPDGVEGTTVSVATSDEACDPEQIRMSPQVPPDQTTETAVRIQLVISTTASEPCTFEPTPGDIATLISAGGTAVWDSEVCRSTTLLEGPVALTPRWSTVATATWSGRGSGPACSDGEGWAAPGKYALRIGTLGGEPGKTTFRLSAKPAEKKEPEPDGTEAPDDPEDAASDS